MSQIRRVLITGANRGLGFKLAEKISPDHQVILTARDLQKANEAKVEILKVVPQARIDTYQLDISKFDNIKDFCKSLDRKQIDVVVNNGGVNDDYQCERKAFNLMATNLFGMINLSETILNNVSADGKFIFISSMLGKLRLQPKIVRDKLSQPVTKQEILTLARELVEIHETTGKYGIWGSKVQPLYCASKVLGNAYNRYVLANLVKPNQSVFMVHPGWVKTDMGGKEAPGEVEDGVYTSSYLIQNVPYDRNPELHGKYFNDKGQIEDF